MQSENKIREALERLTGYIAPRMNIYSPYTVIDELEGVDTKGTRLLFGDILDAAAILAALASEGQESARDENDDPADWRTLALDAIADLRNYAHDETPERRLVSVEAYEGIAQRLTAPPQESGEVDDAANPSVAHDK